MVGDVRELATRFYKFWEPLMIIIIIELVESVNFISRDILSRRCNTFKPPKKVPVQVT